MEIMTLTMAYAAAAFVALAVTAAFSAPIEEVLFRLLPTEIAPAWQKFAKFALFVSSFAGGMPAPLAGIVMDRNAPAAVTTMPGEGLMVVMSSLSGALMAAAWTLMIFFGVTLTALTAGRVYAAMRRRREMEARDIEEKESARKLEKEQRERTARDIANR